MERKYEPVKPPTPRKHGDSTLFDDTMLRELNKAMSKNGTPVRSFEVDDKSSHSEL